MRPVPSPPLFSEHSPPCLLIGMVHLLPLPGSPKWMGSMQAVLEAARRDAERLVNGGCDAFIVENMGDVPYLNGRVEPETTAAMAVAVERLTNFGIPVGVQVLAGANREALGVALASGASFIRAEAFAYAHVADEGWMDACAGSLLRARRYLGARVDIFADVQKKHAAHAATADLSMEDLAKGTAFCGADGLIVTGSTTGERTRPEDVMAAREANLPVLVGSGVTPGQIEELIAPADGLIVGSWLKEGSDWRRPVDLGRVRQMRAAVDTMVQVSMEETQQMRFMTWTTD